MSASPDPRFPAGAAVTIAGLDRDPHPVLAELRAAEPVSWVPVLGGWLVTRHDLAVHVMRDAAAFTVDDPRFSTAQVLGPSMLSLDGPEHVRHRDPFARSLRPARTRARYGSRVAAEVDRLVTALRPAGAAELRAAFAGPLAVAVIGAVLGLRADAATVRSWYEEFVTAISGITAGAGDAGAGDAALVAAREALRAYVLAAIDTGDPASLLAGAAGGADGRGGGLTAAEVVANAAVVMFGGIDTMEGMIGNAVLHLLSHPEALKRVRAEPALLPAAVEESARLEPAAALIDRYATGDVALGDVPIRAGELVRVSLAAANRDPAVFAAPDRFDIGRRDTGAHLAFAHGPHFCFGAPLARLETRTALSGLLDLLPGLRLDPARPAAPRGLVFRRPPRLHVRWDR